MGFLDGLFKKAVAERTGTGGAGGVMELVSENPQILAAVAGLLSTRDSSIGGSGGLAGLVGAFQRKGLGDMIAGWISTGPNPPVSAAQLTDVLGDETVGQFASKAGVPAAEAGSVLAGLLPTVIDRLTPKGTLPETDSLESSLKSMLSGLGK
jgi:uncharacterized protein YidB (DUF937 family)